MTDQPQTLSLAGVRLPLSVHLRREMPLPPEKRSDRYIRNFDERTLVYDAFFDPARREIVMISPRLLNLWKPFRDGLKLDGVAAGRRLRRRVRLRYEELRLPLDAGDAAPGLTVDIGGASVPIRLNEKAEDLFSGRNCLITQQKDTPVEWIEDWLRWHVATHGADAALIFDNGSTLNDPGELQARLSKVDGLAVCRVISDPFPYGDNSGGRFYVPAKFLQVAMLNLARLRFLGRARGVLSLDVDEFLRPPRGAGVFDRVQRAPLGLISFRGRWVYPPKAGGAQPQRAHSMVAAKGGLCRNPKWCARPGHRAARLSWAVHRPGGAFFGLTLRREPAYWHFRATSTGWKTDRSELPAGLVPAPELLADLSRYLGP